MFNPRISGIFAGAGFVLSFLVGLVSGAHFPLILIRALVFALIFFALASAGYGAVKLYLPELLSGNSGGEPVLGAQVDISVGDDDDGILGISLESHDVAEGLNDFSENPGDSGIDALDQTFEGGYTEEGRVEELAGSSRPALPEDPGFSSGETDSVDMLPDLDSMSGVFSDGSVPAKGGESSGTGSPAGSFGGMGASGGHANKKSLDEDFNVQEMASAIRTILKRENKG
jgi:hypothetical protein